jgi:hypothetical protein
MQEGFPDLGDVSEQHSAGAGNSIVMLSTRAHELRDVLSHCTFIGMAGMSNLMKARRIDIQGGYVYQELVVAQR